MFDVTYYTKNREKIRLPIYLLPINEEKHVDEKHVDHTDLFYKFFPVASLFLCKPFEYLRQTIFFPELNSMIENKKEFSHEHANYVHIGEHLNGIWPFLLESLDLELPKDDPRVLGHS